MEEATFIKLLSGQKDDLKQIIEENGVVIRGVIRAEIDPIKTTLHDLITAEKKRNNKIEKLEDKTTVLEQSDSNRSAVRKAVGRYFVVGCAILAAAGTIITIISKVG